MKSEFVLGAAILVIGSALVGCGKTAEGVKEDTQANTEQVQSAADKTGAAIDRSAMNAGHEVRAGAKNAMGALMTPKVKNAIIMDSQLNDTRNHINVDTTDGIVVLRGHVVNNAMKQRASDIAEKTLKESSSTDKLKNELTIQSQ